MRRAPKDHNPVSWEDIRNSFLADNEDYKLINNDLIAEKIKFDWLRQITGPRTSFKGNPLCLFRWIVSHEKNVVYSEIHSAALTSLAFICHDTQELLQ